MTKRLPRPHPDSDRKELLGRLATKAGVLGTFPTVSGAPFENAIVAASFLDGQLEVILRRKLRGETPRDLFEGTGALSSFSAKIEVVWAMGLIDDALRRELHLVRKIRNEFAHAIHPPKTFEAKRLAPLVRALAIGEVNTDKSMPHANDLAWRFEISSLVLFGLLAAVSLRVRRVRAPGRGLGPMIRATRALKDAAEPR